MPKGFRFIVGRFTFYYSVLVDDTELGIDFELDLIGVWFNSFAISDDELDVVDCEKTYDSAFEQFKKEYL